MFLGKDFERIQPKYTTGHHIAMRVIWSADIGNDSAGTSDGTMRCTLLSPLHYEPPSKRKHSYEQARPLRLRFDDRGGPDVVAEMR